MNTFVAMSPRRSTKMSKTANDTWNHDSTFIIIIINLMASCLVKQAKKKLIIIIGLQHNVLSWLLVSQPHIVHRCRDSLKMVDLFRCFFVFCFQDNDEIVICDYATMRRLWWTNECEQTNHCTIAIDNFLRINVLIELRWRWEIFANCLLFLLCTIFMHPMAWYPISDSYEFLIAA